MTDSVISPQWLTVPLEDVILRIVGGGTPSKSKPEYYQGKIPWMSVKDMNKHVLHDTVDHISQAAVDNSSTNVIPSGTPIIATRMSLGKIVIADFDSAINQDLKALFLPAEIHRDYLVYWYRSVARKIEQMGTGTTVKGVRLEALKGLEFALPPLAEQKIIADKLDTLLAQVENTKARLERIPQILKRFRQSVLAVAVSGRLTEEWREREKSLQWVTVSLKDVAEIKDPHPSHRTPKRVENGIPYIGIGDLKPDGSIDFENARTVSEEVLSEHKCRYQIKLGDFIFGKIGTLGKVTTLPTDRVFTLSANVILIQPKTERAVPSFLMYFLSAPGTIEEVARQANSTSQAAFGIKKMRAFVTSLPSLEEQTEIVRRVDQLFAHTDRIEQQVNNALARVNNLTQSILAKAFRGKLTEQWRKDNPELISGENSAEALLERIKAERAAAKPAKRARKKVSS